MINSNWVSQVSSLFGAETDRLLNFGMPPTSAGPASFLGGPSPLLLYRQSRSPKVAKRSSLLRLLRESTHTWIGPGAPSPPSPLWRVEELNSLFSGPSALTSPAVRSLSCVRLCDPMACSPPGSSVHGVSQTRVLEWVAVFSSRGPSWLRAGTCVSYVSCICRGFLTPEPRGKPLIFLGTLFYQLFLLSVVWPAFLCPPSHFHLLLFSFFWY